MHTPARTDTVIWDLPVRLTHWLLVSLFAVSWITAEQGWLGAHQLSGYGIVTLVLFRAYWGFAGSAPARFARFVRGPRTVLRWVLRRQKQEVVGHNPLGGWNIVAMLLLLLLQAGLGLFAVDINGLESGPFSDRVSFDVGRRIARAHALVFNILLTLVALHVAAIVLHLLLTRENLIAPMLSGRKRVASAAPQPNSAPRLHE